VEALFGGPLRDRDAEEGFAGVVDVGAVVLAVTESVDPSPRPASPVGLVTR